MGHTLLIFAWVYLAMTAIALWESHIEGRNAWGKGKLGWKVKILGFTLHAYHFYLFWVMIPIFLTLPFVIFGFDLRIFGIILSAYFSGTILEDFLWYVFNPVVKLREFYTPFSDYYPWIKIGGKKIIPVAYLINLILALLSWFFIWR